MGFVTLQWGFLYTASPSVSSLNNLKIHKTKAVKNINLYTRKSIVWLIFNLGLASTSFRTTQPWVQQDNLTWAHNPIENQDLDNSLLQKKNAT